MQKKLHWAKNGTGKNIRMENSREIQIVVKKCESKKLSGKKLNEKNSNEKHDRKERIPFH